jgi:hypothetical protein
VGGLNLLFTFPDHGGAAVPSLTFDEPKLCATRNGRLSAPPGPRCIEVILGFSIFHRRTDVLDPVVSQEAVKFLDSWTRGCTREVSVDRRLTELAHSGQEAVVGVDHEYSGPAIPHPKGVGYPSGELHPTTWTDLPDIIATANHHATLEKVETVVEGGVDMGWRGGPFREDCLGHRHRTGVFGQLFD